MIYDTDVIERELNRAGFSIVKVGYIDRRAVYIDSGSKDGGCCIDLRINTVIETFN